jgi:hypothetical protein
VKEVVVVKPHPNVRLQAAAVAVVAVIALAVLDESAAWPIAITSTFGGTIWLLFGLRYRAMRGRTSELRTSRDAIMRANFVVGLLVPAFAAWGVVIAGGTDFFVPPVKGAAANLLALAAVLIPLAMLVSSAVDWYLIRPWRDGVLGPPACQSSQHCGASRDYTMYWVMHRMTSECLVFASVALLLADITFVVADQTDSQGGQAVVGFVSLVGLGVWAAQEAGKVRAAINFVRFPTPGVGEWIAGRNELGPLNGFALDVSLDPGLQLVAKPRGRGAVDIAEADQSIPLRNRKSVRAIEPPEPVCPRGRCQYWFPDCEWGLVPATEDEREEAARV